MSGQGNRIENTERGRFKALFVVHARLAILVSSGLIKQYEPEMILSRSADSFRDGRAADVRPQGI
jgi:hypothetical protein